MSNIKATFTRGETALTVHGLTQWDRGRELEITHPDLPAVLEVHFATVGTREAVVRAVSTVNGTATAAIPNELLEQSRTIMAWAYIVSETGGETILTVTMPVRARAKPAGAPTLPEDMSDKYTEALEAINVHAGRRDNPHGITAAQIGAALAGYGLGESKGRVCTNPNDAIEPGFYAMNGTSIPNLPNELPAANWASLLVERNLDTIQQTLTRANVMAVRYGIASTKAFMEWEYVNPPMQDGVEYRESDAEDAVQNAFVKIVKHINKIDFSMEERSIRAYILKIVANEAISVANDYRILEDIDDLADRIEDGDFFGMLRVQERYEDVVEAIQQLDERYSIPLALRCADNMEIKAIAELLGISEKSVYTRLERARKKLIEILNGGKK